TVADIYGHGDRCGRIAIIRRGLRHLQRRMGRRPSHWTGDGRVLVRAPGIARALVHLGAGGCGHRARIVAGRQIFMTIPVPGSGFWVPRSGSWFFGLKLAPRTENQNLEPRTWNQEPESDQRSDFARMPSHSSSVTGMTDNREIRTSGNDLNAASA